MIAPPAIVVALLPVAWAAMVVWWRWPARPPARRSVRPRIRGASRSGAGAPGAYLAAAAGAVGAVLRRLGGRPADPRAARRLGAAVLAAAPLLVVAPPLAPVAVMAVWSWPVLRRRAAARRHERSVADELPDIVDLLVLAVGSGLTIPLAVAAVGRRGTGPVAAELRRAAAEVAMGRRLADALDDLAVRLGPLSRPLVTALVTSERYGTPALATLEGLALEARARRRRRAEEAARRVPVKLLFPLVLCTLPAFALLTVAPLLAGAVRDLRP